MCYCCCNSNYPRNHGKFWSSEENRTVRRMRARGFTYGAIARRMGRTPQAIRERHAYLRGDFF